jgi:hypothetical protein
MRAGQASPCGRLRLTSPLSRLASGVEHLKELVGFRAMTWVAVMIGIATVVGLSLGGADREYASYMLCGLYAATAIVVLAFPRSREAAVQALIRHWAATLALLILVSLAMGGAGAFGKSAATAPYLSATAAWSFLGLGFAALTAAGGADAAGRNRLLIILQVVPIVLAAMILLDQIDGVPDFFGLSGQANVGRGLTGPFNSREELGAVFALFILLATFAALDELRRRPTPGVYGFPPLARRLLLPAGSMLVSLNVLAVSGSRGSMVAVIVGVLVMWAILTGRLGTQAQPTRIMSTPAVAAIVAVIAAAAAAAIPAAFELVYAAGLDSRPYAFMGEAANRAAEERAWTGFGFGAFPTISANYASPDAVLSGYGGTSADFAVWRIEAGVIGISVGILALIAYLGPLGLLRDRGRRPSRGLALGVGVAAVCLVSGLSHAVLSNPAVAHFAALLLGFSAVFVDEARRSANSGGARGGAGASIEI